MDAANYFDQAMAAITAENSRQARELLQRVVELDPDHLQAWQWLGSLAENSSERIVALEHLLRLDPGNPVARQRLDQLLARRAAQERRLAGDPPEGGNALPASSPRQPTAARTPGSRQLYLSGGREQAGETGSAASGYASYGQALEQGMLLEQQGDLDSAVYHYIEASRLASTLGQSLNARRRLEQTQLRIEAPHFRPAPARSVLVRLALAPAPLFLILVGLETGAGWFLAVPFALLGLASILLGSALLAITTTLPLQVDWYVWWERRGYRDSWLARSFVWLAGAFLVLWPYSLLAIYSIFRLECVPSWFMGC